MSEETTVIEKTEQKTETKPVVASFGTPQRANGVSNRSEPDKNSGDAESAKIEKPINEQPKLTEEQRTAFFKELGIDYKGEDDLAKVKEKLSYTPPSAEPTEEEKKAASLAEEKEIFDLFSAGGGTIEQFAAIKNIMNADVKELSRTEKINELVEGGFDKEESEAILKERYYQDKLDTLEIGDDETDEEFEARKAKLEKKVKFFSDKLENSAATAKTQAEQLYNNFKTLISDKKLEAKKELEHAANAEALLKKLPREQTFELGKLNDQDLAPVRQKVEETDIQAVGEILKSPAKIKQLLFNEDGSYNLKNLTDLLLSHQRRNDIARHGLLEGQTRMTRIKEATFPARTAHQVGLSGAPQNRNGSGKVASFGKTQRVN